MGDTSQTSKAEYRRSEVFGWAMFDFANSSFTTVVTTAFFTTYFVETVVGGDGTARGFWGDGKVLRSTSEAIAQGLVLLAAPLLGALADFSGSKKRFLHVTWLGCAIFTIALGAVREGDVLMAMLLYIGAAVCFASGENFISAFLPEIAPNDKMGRISGLAWGCGYIGGIGSLLLAVWILTATDNQGYRWVWVMTGFWFLLAGLPTFVFVKERHKKETLPAGATLLSVGFRRVAATVRQARRYRQLFRFLGTFVVFNTGVASVIVFAGYIAKESMGLDAKGVGLFLIVTNITAVGGAFAGGWLSDRITARRTLMIALLGWLTAAVTVAFVTPGNGAAPSPDAELRQTLLFWSAGTLVGVSMGMTYATSRGMVGSFSPIDKSGEFFGLWGMSLRLSQILGPFWFSTVSHRWGDRTALASLGVFFLAGLLMLFLFIDEAEGRRVAGHALRGSPVSPPSSPAGRAEPTATPDSIGDEDRKTAAKSETQSADASHGSAGPRNSQEQR